MRVRRVAPHFTGAALAVAISADTVWAGDVQRCVFESAVRERF